MILYKLIKYLRDGEIKLYRKLLFLLPVVYFFSPINLIPYLIFPVMGWLDNIIVTAGLIFYLKKVLDNYEPRSSSSQKDKDSIIDIQDDDYEVK
ncbi:MAG: YkvA family protein [bacterium]